MYSYFVHNILHALQVRVLAGLFCYYQVESKGGACHLFVVRRPQIAECCMYSTRRTPTLTPPVKRVTTKLVCFLHRHTHHHLHHTLLIIHTDAKMVKFTAGFALFSALSLATADTTTDVKVQQQPYVCMFSEPDVPPAAAEFDRWYRRA